MPLVAGILGFVLAVGPGANADSRPLEESKPEPLTTPWTADVDPDAVLPEYPRPQLVRAQWRNLNGSWQYERASDPQPPFGRTLAERILVPYPPESMLSGIERHDDRMWYRRSFEVPPDWAGQRLLLHFGAVDQEATVWVNGQRVATHQGGYTAFQADITDALRGSGPQELIVGAVDRNERAPYPVGKQRDDPGGILYRGSSGIWQTVWMEPVPQASIDALELEPDVAGEALRVRVRATGVTEERAEIVVRSRDGTVRARGEAVPNGDPSALSLPGARLWTPEDPYLYDVTVRLVEPDGAVGDKVSSYAGMRSIELLSDDAGRQRIALNGKITYQHGPLDQGYWPDGGYTAPTDEALRFDLEQTKKLGFNMIRKHVKVEPARWYYWADRLGLLVWQDMPSLPVTLDDPPGPQPPPGERAQRNFERELADLIEQLYSVPSIVAWVPFNEGWGEFDTARVSDWVKWIDPARLVDANSGVNCCHSHPDSGAGDIYDDHTYVGPGDPDPDPDRAIVDGEYGGLGLVVPGHLWPGEPQAYEMTESRVALLRRYRELTDDLLGVIGAKGLSASVYTQLTDVENEVNGLFSYDRRVRKFDESSLREVNSTILDAGTPSTGS
ncbi:glycosyl hydrolase family 2 [Tamaricihabitans halophyticus]|uniref:Glycosyl hydrolase family 2 n=1 Tax=Tamaricihabitans halophyticus TaxID=1262583 RepID=A0A4R2R3A3_9PSEU|nr:glycosyl hydrolase family 2 [Tamaricihabitans halophyticus]